MKKLFAFIIIAGLIVSAISAFKTRSERRQALLNKVTDKTIRIIEGWDLRNIKSYLIAQGITDAENLYDLTGSPAVDYKSAKIKPPDLSADFPVLKTKPSYVSLEGYLFPDTYKVSINANATDVVNVMLKNTERKIAAIPTTEISKSGRSIFQILTMASIIEEEVQTPSDRRLVADIFWRRLALGMSLQADSTVNYATAKKKASVSFKDLETNSAYNTYKNAGLPLGPIANAGLDSIMAAITPTPNQYLYFLTDKSGKVYYARTFEEHLVNKQKFLR